MNIHVKAIRYQDEIQCSYCGKSWDVKEDAPPCETKREHNKKKFEGLREELFDSQKNRTE